jgi:hypothetical protein
MHHRRARPVTLIEYVGVRSEVMVDLWTAHAFRERLQSPGEIVLSRTSAVHSAKATPSLVCKLLGPTEVKLAYEKAS